MADVFALDRPLILDRLGGDEDILLMMVEMFLADVDSYCEALAGSFAAGDAEALMREAHSVKGLLATFSDETGAEAAFAIETQARQGQLDGLSGGVNALQERLQEVADVLRREFSVG